MSEPRLSAARDALLARLLVAVDARRRRRRLVRSGLVLVFACALLAVARREREAPPAATRAVTTATAPERVHRPAEPSSRLVHDDPALVARWRASARLPADCIVKDRSIDPELRIGDDELLRWLEDAGHRSGYVRSGANFALTRPLGE
jgi:hypothetical protein